MSCRRRVLAPAILILTIFALIALPGQKRIAAASKLLAWSEDPASVVTGFAVTVDGVRTDYGLTPLPASGPCGCSIPLPFTIGEHTVVLSAYNTGGETFGPPLIVGPTANAGGPYAGQAATTLAISASGTTDNLGTITSYVWQWGDGTANTSSASPTASHVYASAGTFTITLTVTDDFPASNSTTTTATITSGAPPPPPSLTSLSPTSGAAGTSVTVAGTNFGAAQGTSTVTFNGTATTPTGWTATSLTAPVPAGATAGPLVVTVGSQASNGLTFTVTPTVGLPAPWTAQDVGGPALPGNTTYSAGTFSVTGAGADIWSANDQFQFVYQPLNGDGQIVALVNSLQAIDPWTKAGVMIRADLTASAANAIALVTPGNGLIFQERVTSGGASTGSYPSALFPGVAPYWLQLVRSGNTLTGYYSADGITWIPMGTTAAPMATQVYIGLAVTSHNPALVATATFSNVTITGAGAPPAPTLTSLTPAAGAVGTPVTIAGTNFGTTQGTSTVTVNGMATTPTGWTATSFTTLVPAGATTGPVVVTVGGQASNGLSFTVTPPPPPGAPTSPNPASGATGISATPTLTWTAANATSYDVQFGTANPPPSVVTGQAAASYTPASLSAGTTYFWQIVAHGSGSATTGSVWSLTTVPLVPPSNLRVVIP